MSFKSKNILSCFTVFYLLIRLPFLLRLPIFNDEGIYLDWANRMINKDVSLFYPLYDGKQPFLMWIFGAFEKVFADPLLAGRLVSVLTGLASMLGLYILCNRYFNRKIAIISSALYIVTPIFSFYDRQALMESSITAINIWSFYLLLMYLEKYSLKFASFLGVILGVGFFIKSSALLFFVPMLLIWVAAYIRNKKERKKLGSGFIIFVVYFILTTSPLLAQEQSDLIFSGSKRYVLTFSELIKFPFNNWVANIKNALGILTWYLFPSTLLLVIAGVYTLSLKRRFSFDGKYFKLVLWLLTTLIITLLAARQVHSRYLVSYLPLLTVLAAQGIFSFPEKVQKLVIIFTITTPLIATLWINITFFSQPINTYEVLIIFFVYLF